MLEIISEMRVKLSSRTHRVEKRLSTSFEYLITTSGDFRSCERTLRDKVSSAPSHPLENENSADVFIFFSTKLTAARQ